MDHETLGYACGVLCGSGFIKHGRNYCVGLQTNNGILAEHFAESLRAIRGFETLTRKKAIDDKRYFIVNAYGKELVSIFDNIGFFPTRRSWLPPKISYDNPEFRSGLLAGFFDTASYVYFNREKFSISGSGYRYLRATSVNTAGLVEIKKLLLLEGIESNLRTTKGGLSYLTIRGDWRLKTFAERIKLRTSKKESIKIIMGVVSVN
ncbi:MAG: LAGLIDADG family homing endonuclease [Candidatus Aenigmarchaeota archaeon]|nr:LAGLIDADG family homing endonuclease [Candidatus Aenigmarchaeota archaeon]